MRLVVVSPHLDDAIFSCGTLLAAAALVEPPLIVTVCAGVPEEGLLTSLDGQAGFESSADAVRVRREEDIAAAAALGAYVLHLDVLDGQYSDDEREERSRSIERALRVVLELDGTIVAPVGIRHADHQAVAFACEQHATWRYAELPYRALWPDLVPPLPERYRTLPSCEAKAEAIRCYRSQLGDGPPGYELSLAERYYRGVHA